jgi:hypothetical protein
MNELSLEERGLLDKLNKINRRFEPDETKSLWNVCRAYLSGAIKSSILDLPKPEIIEILKGVN